MNGALKKQVHERMRALAKAGLRPYELDQPAETTVLGVKVKAKGGFEEQRTARFMALKQLARLVLKHLK